MKMKKFGLRICAVVAALAVAFTSCESSGSEGDDASGDVAGGDVVSSGIVGEWKGVFEYDNYNVVEFDDKGVVTNITYYTDDTYISGFKADYQVNGCVLLLSPTHLLNTDDGSFKALSASDLADMDSNAVCFEVVEDQLLVYYFIDGPFIDQEYNSISEVAEDYVLQETQVYNRM